MDALATESKLEFPALRDPRYPVHKIADALEPYLRVIVERFEPEKIILFGSQAYGKPNEHSDVDLLVIRELTSERESNLAIRGALCEVDGENLPFTILSKSPERIRNRLAVKSPFYEDMVYQGLLLYARPD